MNFGEIIITNAGDNRLHLKDIENFIKNQEAVQEGDILYYSQYSIIINFFDFRVVAINKVHNYIVLEVVNH